MKILQHAEVIKTCIMCGRDNLVYLKEIGRSEFVTLEFFCEYCYVEHSDSELLEFYNKYKNENP